MSRLAGRRRIPTRYATLLTLLGVAVVYYAAARLGLRLALVGESVTPFWPPTGVAVVALLAFGYRIWPAIAVAAFAVNAPIGPTPVAAAFIAAGNTLAPMLTMWLLRRVGFRQSLERVRDAGFIVGAALAGMLVSATIGSATLTVADAIGPQRFLESWTVWWTGDAMGVLIVAPFLWSLRDIHPLQAWRWPNAVEAVALLALLLGGVVTAMRTDHHLLFIVLPLLGWIAWRFQQQGAGPAGLLVSVLATWAAVHDLGPFAGETLVSKMIVLQSYNASVAFTSVFFAAAVAERLRVEEERRRLAQAEREAQAELYRREHRIAETLQRSLLPERLPETPGIRIAARYVPAGEESEVGGDWYDIIPLPRGGLGLVIGDVAGHGIAAAAVMGQIRMALRAYALEDLSPADALHRLNLLLLELQPGAMATALYARYDPDSGEVRFASAGHPPPLVLGDEAGFVRGGLAPPLGISPHVRFEETSAHVHPGGTLLLYTDGLVEKRRASIDDGLRRLERAARDATGDLEAMCDQVVRSLLKGDAGDDVALLALQPESFAGQRLELRRPAVPSSVPEVRRVVRRWLRQNGFTADETHDVLVAFSEAYTNAVQHAYGTGEGAVDLVAEMRGSGDVVLTVRDRGSWKTSRAGRESGGRGLEIMRQLMDDVQIEASDMGTHVVMTRGRRVRAAHG